MPAVYHISATARLTGQTSAVSGQGSAPASGSATSPSAAASTTTPVIKINGDNPATIRVGDTYNDLGATITVSVDGGATTTPDQIQIGTTQPGTHTILYSATDQSGQLGTATRSVIVKSAIAPVSTAASSTAATTTTPTGNSPATTTSSVAATSTAPTSAP